MSNKYPVTHQLWEGVFDGVMKLLWRLHVLIKLSQVSAGDNKDFGVLVAGLGPMVVHHGIICFLPLVSKLFSNLVPKTNLF